MKKIIIILAFLVCGISSAQQYFFNGTVYVPKTTVQINAIVSPPEGRVEANSDTGSLWYFDGAIWKDTFVGVSSFADLEGDPYDNVPLSDALNSKAADSVVVKTSLDSQIQNLKLAVGDSAWIASKTFGANDIVINTDENPPGGDNYVTGGTLSGAGVLSLEMNYGPDITVPGFNSGGGAESGTFTADLSDSGGGATYTVGSSSKSYYAIGDLVYINVYFSSISVSGSPSGDLEVSNISGLPGGFGSSSWIPNFIVAITSSSESFSSLLAAGSNTTPNKIIIYKSDTDTSTSNTTPFPAPSSISSIRISGVYKK